MPGLTCYNEMSVLATELYLGEFVFAVMLLLEVREMTVSTQTLEGQNLCRSL